MITHHGIVDVPQSIIDHAETIKLENYKTTSPAKFQKHTQLTEDAAWFAVLIACAVQENTADINWVYFSVCQGAEPHVDQLDPNRFTDTTYVIPIILPKKGTSTITAGDDSAVVELNHIYEFDHTQIHSMVNEDTESGCVVVMVAIER